MRISKISFCLALFFAAQVSLANSCYVSKPSELSFEKEDQAASVVVEWNDKIRRIFIVNGDKKTAVNGLNCSSSTPYVCKLDDDGGKLGVTFDAQAAEPVAEPAEKLNIFSFLSGKKKKPSPTTDAMTLSMVKGELFADRDDGQNLEVYVGQHEKDHSIVLYKKDCPAFTSLNHPMKAAHKAPEAAKKAADAAPRTGALVPVVIPQDPTKTSQ